MIFWGSDLTGHAGKGERKSTGEGHYKELKGTSLIGCYFHMLISIDAGLGSMYANVKRISPTITADKLVVIGELMVPTDHLVLKIFLGYRVY
jgi:hypothetical protein